MASNGRLVSIKRVANKLMQNPLLKELNWEFIVSNGVECMRILGTPAMFVPKREAIEIKNSRGSIPIDIEKIEQVFKVSDNGLLPMTKAQDTLQEHFDMFPSAQNDLNGSTYTMSHGKIYPNFTEGTVVIVYKGIATDEECWPLLPDNAELLRAVETYIKWKWYDILNDMDKLSDRKLAKAEQDYMWNAGQAQSNLQMPDIDEMEALVNQITQILPSRTQHADRFQFLGSQEFLRYQ